VFCPKTYLVNGTKNGKRKRRDERTKEKRGSGERKDRREMRGDEKRKEKRRYKREEKGRGGETVFQKKKDLFFFSKKLFLIFLHFPRFSG